MSANASLKETDEKDKMLEEIIAKHKDSKGALIPILHDVQELYGYLPVEAQETIAKKMRIPLSEVYGVLSFYSHFVTEPRGKYTFSVCMGTACYVKGAGLILDELKDKLKLTIGETSEDGMYTLEECRCLGACGLAPVLTVNSQVYGRLTRDDVAGIIENCKSDEGGTL